MEGAWNVAARGFLIKALSARKGNCLLSAACVSVCLPETEQVNAVPETPRVLTRWPRVWGGADSARMNIWMARATGANSAGRGADFDL